MNKTLLKYFMQFIVIVLIGAGVFFGIGYYRYRTSPEYKKYQDLLALKERYMADTYGGDTPEETLELFISALKAGDIDLASKYFVLDKQEEMRQKFAVGKEKDHLNGLIDFVQKADLGEQLDDERYLFTEVNEQNVAEYSIVLVRYPSRIWKIREL